jgi:hypothetical protein
MAVFIFIMIYMLSFCTSMFFAIYNVFVWLRSFLLLFTMLLHTIPALVRAAIYNDLCMHCSNNLQCFCIPALVDAAIYNAVARLLFVAVIYNVFAYPR